MIKFTIPLAPVTKKNSQQIFTNSKTGKPFVTQSKRYKQYEKDVAWFLKPIGIDYPVNVKALYYIDADRVVDIINLHSALHDCLVKHGVVKDDNYKIIASTDGSRVYIDRENPRTCIEITPMGDEKANE